VEFRPFHESLTIFLIITLFPISMRLKQQKFLGCLRTSPYFLAAGKMGANINIQHFLLNVEV
jgi:hypothetical protein